MAARTGDGAAVEARFPQLCATVDATDDQVAQALARLGWAMARRAVDHPEAGEQLESATARFSALGIDPDGWTAVLRQAAGMEPAEAVPA